MARQPPFVVPGQPHYLVQRGHNFQPVFVDDTDRDSYVQMLAEAARAERVLVHAHALRPTGVQLLVMPLQAGALGRMVQALGRRYGAAFNRRHGRVGTLWEGRFRTAVVEPGACALHCMQMIDSVGLRLSEAGTLEPQRWSSAAHRLGLRRDPLVSDPPEFWRLGNTPFEREIAYRELLAQGADAGVSEQLEQAAQAGRAWGSTAFLLRLSERTGRTTQPRRRGRPPKPASER
jgi:putative transposase